MSNRNEQGDLFRSTTDKWLLGVCGGIAKYFNWKNANIFRIFMIIEFIFTIKYWYIAVLGYLFLAFIIPEEK
jgi:phage shock protein PspC (stress-responsive transcriptional regulator)